MERAVEHESGLIGHTFAYDSVFGGMGGVLEAFFLLFFLLNIWVVEHLRFEYSCIVLRNTDRLHINIFLQNVKASRLIVSGRIRIPFPLIEGT